MEWQDPMTPRSTIETTGLWDEHHHRWRDPHQVVSIWEAASTFDRQLLHSRAYGHWWDVLEETNSTLLVTREYEHLAIALHAEKGRPVVSYLNIPHPSGLAIDREQNIVYMACTRNPNQVIDLRPSVALMPRLDAQAIQLEDRPLLPARIRFFPGSMYLHELAMIDGQLYANAVGQNTVVRLQEDGTYERIWWPKCIERDGEPFFGRNYIQLNSIAAGRTLEASFFSASSDKVSHRRPGHLNFPVDKRGVIFSGSTREPVVRGLTRPHSARLYNGALWVDNSGYGELSVVENGRLSSVTKLPGWTRGLAFQDGIAFVGTSRVLPRFRQYAPGLNHEKSRCGIHAVDTTTGNVLGSLIWTYGNQIFAIEMIPKGVATGLPFQYPPRRASKRETGLFYAFQFEPLE